MGGGLQRRVEVCFVRGVGNICISPRFVTNFFLSSSHVSTFTYPQSVAVVIFPSRMQLCHRRMGNSEANTTANALIVTFATYVYHFSISSASLTSLSIQKSFPDKSFYVFDGKPLCKYHYHEANESLCAATLCGQPIEGPCAVSHTGDRYHPEHMLCEYPGNPPCRTKLAEYWEVAGRMLCERHAHTSEVESDDERGEGEWVQSSKRRKRVTRFIDLAGGLSSGGLR